MRATLTFLRVFLALSGFPFINLKTLGPAIHAGKHLYISAVTAMLEYTAARSINPWTGKNTSRAAKPLNEP